MKSKKEKICSKCGIIKSILLFSNKIYDQCIECWTKDKPISLRKCSGCKLIKEMVQDHRRCYDCKIELNKIRLEKNRENNKKAYIPIKRQPRNSENIVKKCKICKMEKTIVKYHLFCDECKIIMTEITEEKRQKKNLEYRKENREEFRVPKSRIRKCWCCGLDKEIKKDCLYCEDCKCSNDIYKMHRTSSASVRSSLIRQKKSFIFDYLPYTIEELIMHIESNFIQTGNEWMNWENWGIYKKDTWRDNDKSTWKWNLDHIIPHIRFRYTSMDCQEFRDCWALSNLRPYSAKLNVLEKDRKNNMKDSI